MKSDDPFTLDLTEYITKGCFTAEAFKAFCEIALSMNKEGFSLHEMGYWLEKGRRGAIYIRNLHYHQAVGVNEIETLVYEACEKVLEPKDFQKLVDKLQVEGMIKFVKPTAEKFLESHKEENGPAL